MTTPDSATEMMNPRSRRARDHVLKIASALFYAKGARAVGMEEIVETSGVAKTTIYRHFPTKDALIAAFLEKEDRDFWGQWDAALHGAESGAAKLDALAVWVGQRVRRDGYRGCPQINLAAEFADPAHPARALGRRHKAEMLRRLENVCREAGAEPAAENAMVIALLFDGAFMSDGRMQDVDAPRLLKAAINRLLRAT